MEFLLVIFSQIKKKKIIKNTSFSGVLHSLPAVILIGPSCLNVSFDQSWPVLSSLFQFFFLVWKGNWPYPMSLGKTSNNWLYVFKFLTLGDKMGGAEAFSQSWSVFARALHNWEWQQLCHGSNGVDSSIALTRCTDNREKSSQENVAVYNGCFICVQILSFQSGDPFANVFPEGYRVQNVWETQGTLVVGDGG